jgi:hypothetical protein
MLPMTWTRNLLPMSSLLVRMKVLMNLLNQVLMKVLTRRLSRGPRLSEVGLTHKHI